MQEVNICRMQDLTYEQPTFNMAVSNIMDHLLPDSRVILIHTWNGGEHSTAIETRIIYYITRIARHPPLDNLPTYW